MLRDLSSGIKLINKLLQILPLILIFSLFEVDIFSKFILNRSQIIAHELTCLITRDCLAVSIAESVDIELNSEISNQGKLEKWNLKRLTISRGRNSTVIPVDQIKKIEFKGDIWIPHGNSYVKITEEQRTTENQKTWSGIPLMGFSLAQGSKIALLQLKGVLEEKDWQYLVNNSQDSIYIIDEIEFDQLKGTMTVKASMINRKR